MSLLKFIARYRRLIYSIGLFFLALGTFSVLFTPTPAHAVLKIEPVFEILGNTESGTGAHVKAIWQDVISYINYFVIALLIVVAFAQILRLNVSTYGVKKILPTLILAIIAANFSFLFCRLLIDLANITMSFFLKGPRPDSLYFNMSGEPWANPDKWKELHGVSLKDAGLGQIFWFLIVQLFVIAGGLMLLVLSYLFFIRVWMIYFLVVLAPLAFMAMVMPQTKSVFNQWWSNFAKWVFLPVVSIFWIWLGNEWVGTAYIQESNDYVMTYVFAAICYFLALSTPFKLGGTIMTSWANIAKKPFGKAAGWGWGKAKEKWINPWVDDAKRRVGNWYQSHGNKKYHPLGILVRRAHRVAGIREWRKKEEEGWANQNFREAFGGKLGEGHDGTQFMSRKEQDKWGEWLDNIDSLFGEKEWKELDLREKYFRTPKGKEAALRSAQYGFRMEKTQTEVDNVKRSARIKGLARDNEYMKDEHYAAMVDQRNKSKAKAFALEMEERKIEGDIFQTVEGNSYLLDIALEGVNFWRKDLEKLLKERKERGAQMTEKERGEHWAKIKEARRQLNKADAGYQQTLGKLYNKYYNKEKKEWEGLSYMFKDMVTDERGNLLGIETDAQGNFVRADATKARALADVMGFKEGTTSYGYYNTRRTKRMSIITKEELASVAAKRTAEDSWYEIENSTYEMEALRKMLANDWGGMTEEQIRKTSAELANVIIGAGDIMSSTFATNHSKLISHQAEVAADFTEAGAAVRETMAAQMSAALTGLANNQLILDSARNATMGDYEADIKKAIDEKNAELESDGKDKLSGAAESTFRKDYVSKVLMERKDFKESLSKRLSEELARQTKIEGSELEGAWEAVSVEIDERTGRIRAKMDDSATDEATSKSKAELMKIVNTSIVNGTPRGSMGDGMRAYLGLTKEIFAPGKREAGKQQEEYFGYERRDKIMREAVEREVERRLAEERRKAAAGA